MKELESYESGTCFVAGKDGMKAVPPGYLEVRRKIINRIDEHVHFFLDGAQAKYFTINMDSGLYSSALKVMVKPDFSDVDFLSITLEDDIFPHGDRIKAGDLL